MWSKPKLNLNSIVGSIFSGERKLRNKTVVKNDTEPATREDIYHCFRLILGRDPLEKEWQAHLNAWVGKPLRDVVTQYVTSAEFINRELSVATMESLPIEEVQLDGFKVCVSPSDRICGPLARTGEYEPDVTHFIKAILGKGDCFLDIGANIGFFTCLAASIVGREGKVLAVEPFDYNIKLLNHNVKLNKFDNVEILPIAFSDSKGLVSYDSSGGNSGYIYESTTTLERLFQDELVYGKRMDEALHDVSRSINLIKIDIEGAEYLALSGGLNRLKRDRPVIISEFSEAFLIGVSKVEPIKYLELLLIDDDYHLSVISSNESLYPCQRDLDKVIAYYRSLDEVDHIDIIAHPMELVWLHVYQDVDFALESLEILKYRDVFDPGSG